MTTRVGAVGVEETTGTGGLLRSGGRLEAFPMPLGSDRTLGLAGPNGTPLIGELPAPADPAGGVSCAKACPGRYKLPSTARTSTVMRDIRPSGNFNNKLSRGFPQARRSTSLCDVRLGLRHSRHSNLPPPTSGLPRSTDMVSVDRHVSNVPPADLRLAQVDVNSPAPPQGISMCRSGFRLAADRGAPCNSSPARSAGSWRSCRRSRQAGW